MGILPDIPVLSESREAWPSWMDAYTTHPKAIDPLVRRKTILAACRPSSLTRTEVASTHHIGVSTSWSWLRQSESKPPSSAFGFC